MSRHLACHVSGILPFAHQLLKSAISPGAIVLDATAGNGYDTVHLASCVGSKGHVYALDIQAEAIQATHKHLKQYDLLNCVTLINASHADVAQHVPNNIQAAVFNLGYLPRSNKQLTTQVVSTMAALKQTLQLLAHGGLLVIVAYRGHTEGAAEYKAIQQWATELSPTKVVVAKYELVNLKSDPPVVFALEKL